MGKHKTYRHTLQHIADNWIGLASTHTWYRAIYDSDNDSLGDLTRFMYVCHDKCSGFDELDKRVGEYLKEHGEDVYEVTTDDDRPFDSGADGGCMYCDFSLA